MKNELINKKSKLVYIEILRILACFLVIFNHSDGKGFFLFSACENGSLKWYLYLAMAIVCRVAVPLFFMISGALLLVRADEKLSTIYKKNVLKIFMILVTFAFLYYISNVKNSTNVFSIKHFFREIYSYDYNMHKDISAHLWYLYAYIGFLAYLPFIKALVQNLKTKYFYYLIVISIILSGILPIMECFIFDGNVGLSTYFRTSWILTDIFMYPCIGYFLQERLEIEKVKKEHIILLWLTNIVCIGISCYMATYKGRIDGQYNTQSFFTAFVVVNAITLFLTAKKLCACRKLASSVNKIIISLGSTTFGIYLLHIWIKGTDFNQKVYKYVYNLFGNSMITAFIWCIFMMLVGYVITIILKKIPIIKKLIGG